MTCHVHLAHPNSTQHNARSCFHSFCVHHRQKVDRNKNKEPFYGVYLWATHSPTCFKARHASEKSNSLVFSPIAQWSAQPYPETGTDSWTSKLQNIPISEIHISTCILVWTNSQLIIGPLVLQCYGDQHRGVQEYQHQHSLIGPVIIPMEVRYQNRPRPILVRTFALRLAQNLVQTMYQTPGFWSILVPTLFWAQKFPKNSQNCKKKSQKTV
jgi:hypothetical protein